MVNYHSQSSSLNGKKTLKVAGYTDMFLVEPSLDRASGRTSKKEIYVEVIGDNSSGGGDDLTAASTSAVATATFADSKVSGSTGCNQYNGGYDLQGNGAITFGAIASTQAFCEDLADQEQAMLKGFDDAKTAEVADGDLQLLDSSGDVLMVFGAETP